MNKIFFILKKKFSKLFIKLNLYIIYEKYYQDSIIYKAELIKLVTTLF